MATAGPNHPLLASSSVGEPPGESHPWTNPTDGRTDDAFYATCDSTFTVDALSQYLKLTRFGFGSSGIPAGSTINGILVEVKRKTDIDGVPLDYSTRIIKGGTVSGTDQSAGASWSSTEAYVSFGGSTNLWGLSWLVSDITSNAFGVAISCVDDGLGSGWIASINAVRITIYYTPPTGAPQMVMMGVGF